jgi:peptidoglycan/LPS O-acetylase OafA/YrhL
LLGFGRSPRFRFYDRSTVQRDPVRYLRVATNPGHLTTLTALRFAAALLVFVFHFYFTSAVASRGGYVGVTFFFVLSGFVLMWSRRPGERAARFYWYRFARVWPLHALVVVLVLVLGLTAGTDTNLSLIDGLTSYSLANPPSWSLSDEAFFYALFPFLAAAIAGRRRLAAIATATVGWAFASGLAVALIVGSAALEWGWAYRLPFVRVGEFALGIVLAVMVRRGMRSAPVWLAGLATIAVYGLICWVQPEPWLACVLIAPAFGLLIASCASRELAGELRAPAALVTLGRWSYAFYLTHYPVLIATGRLGLDGLAAFIVAFGATLALSGLLFTCFERPVERWLRSLGRRPVAAPAPARA